MAPFPDTAFPAEPYPGARPGCSFAHVDGIGFPLSPGPWRLYDGTPLDDWLAGHGAAPVAERVPVLAYGSNACPAKITWLRRELGLTGPVVVLRARCTGIAAVWAAGLRQRDGQRPATLAALPGVEWHAVWLATEDQLRVLDVCEGRGIRYHRSRLRGGVELEDGTEPGEVLVYTGASPIRFPLFVDGAPVRCADVPQAEAIGLRGEPGRNGLDGLDVTVLPGPPVR